MGLSAPTIATPSLLKLVLALGFWMESRDDLTTGLHPFVLGQHTATVRKFLRRQADRYGMMASGTGAPLLADVEILLAPDGVTLPHNLSMACGQWLRTRLIVATFFGVDHNASEGLKEFGEEILARETELEEDIPRDAALLPQIPALLLRHAQIRWSNWLASQWGKTSEVPFTNLDGLCTAMENQEPWEPTSPAGYTLVPDTAYGGTVIPRPSQGPFTSSHWNPAESRQPPLRKVTTPPTPKAKPESREGGQGGSTNTNGGGGRGGRSGSTCGDRPNNISYNNAYMEERWGLFRHAGDAANHTKSQRSGRRASLVAYRPQVQGLPRLSHKGYVQYGIR